MNFVPRVMYMRMVSPFSTATTTYFLSADLKTPLNVAMAPAGNCSRARVRARVASQLMVIPLFLQALVRGFDKIVGSPVAVMAVERIVVSRRLRGLDLFERHALFGHGPNTVADDRHHIAIFHDFRL